MITPLTVYNLDIKVHDGTHCHLEKKWEAKLVNQSHIHAAEQGACNLVLAAIEDTWTQRLKDANLFYTQVTPRNLLAQLVTQ